MSSLAEIQMLAAIQKLQTTKTTDGTAQKRVVRRVLKSKVFALCPIIQQNRTSISMFHTCYMCYEYASSKLQKSSKLAEGAPTKSTSAKCKCTAYTYELTDSQVHHMIVSSLLPASGLWRESKYTNG